MTRAVDRVKEKFSSVFKIEKKDGDKREVEKMPEHSAVLKRQNAVLKENDDDISANKEREKLHKNRHFKQLTKNEQIRYREEKNMFLKRFEKKKAEDTSLEESEEVPPTSTLQAEDVLHIPLKQSELVPPVKPFEEAGEVPPTRSRNQSESSNNSDSLFPDSADLAEEKNQCHEYFTKLNNMDSGSTKDIDDFFDAKSSSDYTRYSKNVRRLRLYNYWSTQKKVQCLVQYCEENRYTGYDNENGARITRSRGKVFGYRLNNIYSRADGYLTAYLTCHKRDNKKNRCCGKETMWCTLPDKSICFEANNPLQKQHVQLREEYKDDFFELFSFNPPDANRGDTRHHQITEHTCNSLSNKEIGDIVYEDELNMTTRFNHRAQINMVFIRALENKVRTPLVRNL